MSYQHTQPSTPQQKREAQAGREMAETDMQGAWIKTTDELIPFSPYFRAAYHARYYELRPSYFPPCGCVKALSGWVIAAGCSAGEHEAGPDGWFEHATSGGDDETYVIPA